MAYINVVAGRVTIDTLICHRYSYLTMGSLPVPQQAGREPAAMVNPDLDKGAIVMVEAYSSEKRYTE